MNLALSVEVNREDSSDDEPNLLLSKTKEAIRAEFEELEENEPKSDCFLEFASACDFINCPKNRYSNVFPNECSRVKLDEVDGYGSDYINANFVESEWNDNEYAYIVAQAPLESTVTDFWRMVWEQNTPVVVMLTRLQERGLQKAYRYWPKITKPLKSKFLEVELLSEEASDDITIRKLRLSVTRDKQVYSRECVQIHYEEWPDFGVPKTTDQVLRLLQLVDKHQKELCKEGVCGPVIYHCSAGLGRTGTLVASHISIQNWLHDRPIDVKNTVARLRRQRSHSVQTPQQYEFIYRVVHDALMKLIEAEPENEAMTSSAELQDFCTPLDIGAPVGVNTAVTL